MDRIKRLSLEVLDIHRSKFNDDYTFNKKVLERVAVIRSKQLKNRIAGYITRYVKRNNYAKAYPIENSKFTEYERDEMSSIMPEFEDGWPESVTQQVEIRANGTARSSAVFVTPKKIIIKKSREQSYQKHEYVETFGLIRGNLWRTRRRPHETNDVATLDYSQMSDVVLEESALSSSLRFSIPGITDSKTVQCLPRRMMRNARVEIAMYLDGAIRNLPKDKAQEMYNTIRKHVDAAKISTPAPTPDDSAPLGTVAPDKQIIVFDTNMFLYISDSNTSSDKMNNYAKQVISEGTMYVPIHVLLELHNLFNDPNRKKEVNVHHKNKICDILSGWGESSPLNPDVVAYNVPCPSHITPDEKLQAAIILYVRNDPNLNGKKYMPVQNYTSLFNAKYDKISAMYEDIRTNPEKIDTYRNILRIKNSRHGDDQSKWTDPLDPDDLRNRSFSFDKRILAEIHTLQELNKKYTVKFFSRDGGFFACDKIIDHEYGIWVINGKSLES